MNLAAHCINCHHLGIAHDHYRGGTECSACGCTRFVYRDWLKFGVWVGGFVFSLAVWYFVLRGITSLIP